MTETTTRTMTVQYDDEGRVARETTVTTVETRADDPQLAETSTGLGIARVRRFLDEQARLGRNDAYEVWADKERPEHVITLGDLRALILCIPAPAKP